MGATNCPETPRQKMIAMMYLVLTALLALNVSKEVVQAFVMVESGLSKTITNIDEKNNSLYAAFATAETENPAKVKEWHDKAKDVQREARLVREYIQELKKEIIIVNDGEDPAAIKGDRIYTDSIKKADNLNSGGIVLLGQDNDGKAIELKEKLSNYKKYLKGKLDASQTGLIESIEESLSTKDPDPKGKVEKKKWETVRFSQMPVIAVITMLTKMQTDVSNTESDVINYLYSRIGAMEVTVNKIDAVVKPKSNYIFTGGKYEAEVFLAAFDTTQKPIIYVGKVDSQEVASGVYQYFMAGEQGKDYDTLHVENGRGVYETVRGSVDPNVRWGGLIEIKAPGGNINKYPFKAEYQVAEAGLVVSPTKMNVFYLGVDNPVDISVPGVPKENIDATMTNGSIKKDPATKGWIVRPTAGDLNGKKTAISVNTRIDGQQKNMGSVVFRVKRVPDPVAKIAQKRGGNIAKNRLTAENGVFAEIENFDFKLKFKVISFTIEVIDRGFVKTGKSSSNRFTDAQYGLMRNLKRGDRITFDEIKARGDDGTVRDLAPIIFRIQ